MKKFDYIESACDYLRRCYDLDALSISMQWSWSGGIWSIIISKEGGYEIANFSGRSLKTVINKITDKLYRQPRERLIPVAEKMADDMANRNLGWNKAFTMAMETLVKEKGL